MKNLYPGYIGKTVYATSFHLGFWVYLKDGICYWFPRVLGTSERRCMLLDPNKTRMKIMHI